MSDWQKLEADASFYDARCTQKENTFEELDYCDCDSISSLIMIDPMKTYEFSIFIHSSGRIMINYFGFFVYDNNGNKIEGSWSRPYFRNSYDYRDYESWDRWRAYILPRHIPDTDSDGQPDTQNYMTNGKDWIWPTNASYVALRLDPVITALAVLCQIEHADISQTLQERRGFGFPWL
ncbi:uncharacterized protein LOC134195671 isoform X2 [Corticium candelabrum]|nr:uncharacterized protein LOC134195671 isoform X2 [Corticium candelabrum]